MDSTSSRLIVSRRRAVRALPRYAEIEMGYGGLSAVGLPEGTVLLYQVGAKPEQGALGVYERPSYSGSGSTVRGVGFIVETADGKIRAEWPDGQANNWPGLKIVGAVVAVLCDDLPESDEKPAMGIEALEWPEELAS